LAPLVNGLAVPLLLLSGILLPMSLAPGWLEAISDANPVKHVVDGVRALFLGHVATGVVFWAAFATVALAVAGVALGTRTFQRESS
jgi:ABC-2 type transport system permease protein